MDLVKSLSKTRIIAQVIVLNPAYFIDQMLLL